MYVEMVDYLSALYADKGSACSLALEVSFRKRCFGGCA
jgi:hypothetical protein